MAPSTADGPRPTHAKAPRPTTMKSHIVPAIPLSLSKGARVDRYVSHADADAQAGALNNDHGVPLNGNGVSVALGSEASDGSLTPTSSVAGSEVLGEGAGKINGVAVSAVAEPTSFVLPKENRTELNGTARTPESVKAGAPARGAVSQPLAQLPSTFYPFASSSTSPSTTLSLQYTPPNEDISQRLHYGTHNLVFGGYVDSLSSSSTPPESTGSAPDTMSYPPPVPQGFYDPNYDQPQYYYLGHVYPVPDPNSGLVYAPTGMIPPGGYGYVRGQGPYAMYGPQQFSSYSHHQNLPYHVGHTEAYNIPPHQHSSNEPVGSSMSPQAVSSADDIELARQVEQMQVTNPNTQPVQPTGTHTPVETPSEKLRKDDLLKRMESLSDYLMSCFGHPGLTDFVLELWATSADGHLCNAPIAVFRVHGIIVSRSGALGPVIAERYQGAAASADPNWQGPNTANMDSTIRLNVDRYTTPPAFAHALRFLYGGPFLVPMEMTDGLPRFDPDNHIAPDINPAVYNMDYALGYISAGNHLKLRAIAEHGLAVLRQLTRWDNVEKVLNFGLDRFLDEMWLTDDEKTTELKLVEGSSEPGSASIILQPPNCVARHEILYVVVDFIAFVMDAEFELDTRAPQLAAHPRLPVAPNDQYRSPNPRLREVRFGDHVPVGPTWLTTLLSTILLSLPFGILDRVFQKPYLGDRIGWERVAEIMHAVINEREERRTRLLRGRASPANIASAVASGLYDRLCHEERVDTTNYGSRHRIARSRVPVSADEHARAGAVFTVE